jgi:hypothetical protein
MGTESRAGYASVKGSSGPAFRSGFVASRASWLTLLLVTAVPLRIAAAVDMTGGWYLGVDSRPVVLVQLSQMGSTLQVPGDPTGLSGGTIDSATGAFTLIIAMLMPQHLLRLQWVDPRRIPRQQKPVRERHRRSGRAM